MTKPSVLNRFNATVEQFVEEEGVDFNEAVAGGGGKLMPEGKALARLIQYVEVGPQPIKQDASKPPVNKFFLKFAVWGKGKDKQSTFHEVVDGKMVPGVIRTQMIAVKKDLNSKSGAYKLFKRMNPDKTAKHFAQLINGTFILPIVHNESGEGENKKVYANIDLENISLAVNPVTDEPFDVPEVEDESLFKLFLWNRPSKEDWESLYIEGKNDEGKSKNWIQDTLLSSPEFPGSPLDLLLNGGGAGSAISELPELDEPEQEEVKEVTPPPEELPVKGKGGAKGAKKGSEEAKPEPDVTGEADFGLPSL